jgi:hypothetical protein
MPLTVTVNRRYINWMYLLHGINSDCQYKIYQLDVSAACHWQWLSIELYHWLYLLHGINSDCQYKIYQLVVSAACHWQWLSIGDISTGFICCMPLTVIVNTTAECLRTDCNILGDDKTNSAKCIRPRFVASFYRNSLSCRDMIVVPLWCLRSFVSSYSCWQSFVFENWDEQQASVATLYASFGFIPSAALKW